MNKFLMLIIISIFCFNTQVKAIDYAILISAGQATTDNTFSNSEYWYDLFLAYEDLVLREGYDPANVFVFYGNGTSFNSNRARYQLALHGWGNIVDFDNAYNTLNTEFANIGALVTNNDNLHIRWVVGHGWGNSATTATTPSTAGTGRDPINADDYWVLLQNRNLCVRETEIIRILNQIPNYKRRKFIWMTCHSGCLTSGTNNLNNDRSVIITASRWNQVSSAYNLPGETIHAQLNYIETSALFGQDPLGTAFNGDNNGDGVINMWELWRIADVSPIMTSDPQLGNTGGLANLIYIDEGLQFNNATLPNPIEYRVDNFNTNNTTIQNNSNITIDIDQGFNATGTFNAPVGVILNIRP
jgi:hypothetical protein